jgi:glutamate N-acetyltransferase/amino-acid N-acetyltransferase
MSNAATRTETRIQTIEGGITAPAGFKASGVYAGIKPPTHAWPLDVMLLTAERPVSAAAVFTTNKTQAAPVVVSRANLEISGGRAKAIVCNSGCANACTGDAGMDVARSTVEFVAQKVGCRPEQVLVASTGVIGVGLDMNKVAPGIRAAAAALDAANGSAAARAIMTTDPFPKEYAVSVQTPAGTFRVGGIAKGSGMIEPNMATMLGFLTTDARVAPALLRRALVESARDTFNAITVDGECSTNDCLFALASGQSGVEIDDESYPALLAGIRQVSEQLALGIVIGGEGATKLIAVTVRDARNDDDARLVARTIAHADYGWDQLVAQLRPVVRT